jgi:hypothetical protein
MEEQQDMLKKRKEDNLELFRHYLVEVLDMGIGDLSDEDEELLTDINDDIISLFDEDPSFQKKLENALYNNEQKLTEQKFLLQDKPTKPTVGNWIKHFIKIRGTEMFDNISLSSFLSSSPNVKKLSNKEISRVRSLLMLYRNLKFFPESIKEFDDKHYEIIPIRKKEIKSKDEEKKNKEKSKGLTNNFAENDKPPEAKENDLNTAYSSEEGDHKSVDNNRLNKIENKSKEESRLEKLKKIKDNYEEGSLERKAIESEIRELESRNP